MRVGKTPDINLKCDKMHRPFQLQKVWHLVKMKGNRKWFPRLKDCGEALFWLKESTGADRTQRLDTWLAKFNFNFPIKDKQHLAPEEESPHN